MWVVALSGEPRFGAARDGGRRRYGAQQRGEPTARQHRRTGSRRSGAMRRGGGVRGGGDPAGAELAADAERIEVISSGRHDRYGQVVARVPVDGRDLGETVMDEGLAQAWRGRRGQWCKGAPRGARCPILTRRRPATKQPALSCRPLRCLGGISAGKTY